MNKIVTQDMFKLHVREVINRIEKLLIVKNQEYSYSDDVFHNFNKGLNISLHNTNSAYLWELATKHLQSVKDIVKSIENHDDLSRFTPEMVNEKCGDIITYFILLEKMILHTLESNYE